jgi:hypothetical protein
MKVQWKHIIVKSIVWLAAEILLTLIGLDDLADYSEFLITDKAIASTEQSFPCLVLS